MRRKLASCCLVCVCVCVSVCGCGCVCVWVWLFVSMCVGVLVSSCVHVHHARILRRSTGRCMTSTPICKGGSFGTGWTKASSTLSKPLQVRFCCPASPSCARAMYICLHPFVFCLRLSICLSGYVSDSVSVGVFLSVCDCVCLSSRLYRSRRSAQCVRYA